MPSNNLIKHSHLNPANLARPRRTVIKRAILEAEHEAARILLAARAEATATQATAAREAQQLRERTARETREASLAEWTDLLISARATRDAALVEVERDVLKLAVRIAEKIINREIETRDNTIADIVATALRHARQQEMLTVRINPADAPLVEKHRPRLDATGRARFLDIVPDPRVTRGGCIIESESGTVDAELETQLRVIEQALLARTM